MSSSSSNTSNTISVPTAAENHNILHRRRVNIHCGCPVGACCHFHHSAQPLLTRCEASARVQTRQRFTFTVGVFSQSGCKFKRSGFNRASVSRFNRGEMISTRRKMCLWLRNDETSAAKLQLEEVFHETGNVRLDPNGCVHIRTQQHTDVHMPDAETWWANLI